MSTVLAAKHFGVDRATLRRWNLDGHVIADRIPGSKFVIFETSSIEQHILQQGLRTEDPDIGLEERFWAMVDIGPPDVCWPWLGSKDKKGYGRVKTVGRKNESAHRVAWRLRNGPIPEGVFICHKCDNPPCCNPVDLYDGSNVTNMRDMRDHLRSRFGSRNINAKLNERAVFALRTGRRSKAETASKYAVARSTISSVLTRKSWRHIK